MLKIVSLLDYLCGFSGDSDTKESAWNTQVQIQGWEDPLEKEVATHSNISSGESHGQGSLVGYNPWGHEELDMTE